MGKKDGSLGVSLCKAHNDQTFAPRFLLTAPETPLNSKDGRDVREKLSLQSGKQYLASRGGKTGPQDSEAREYGTREKQALETAPRPRSPMGKVSHRERGVKDSKAEGNNRRTV